MVVPSVVLLGEFALAIDRTAEFAAPDHKRILKHPSLLQIKQQGRGGLVGIAALGFHLLGSVAMGIPAAMIELDEPHTSLSQAPRQQAIVRVPSHLRRIGPIELQDAFWFALNVDQLRYAHLHAKGQLVLGDASGDHRVIEPISLFPVELAEGVEHAPALRARDSVRIVQVENGVTLAAKFNSLKSARQKTCPPETIVKWLACLRPAVGGQGHEGWQILVLAAKPVGHPCPHTRATGINRSGLKERRGGVMIDRLSVHALHQAHIVDHLRHVLQRLAETGPGFSMPGKFQNARRDGKGFLAGGHRRFTRVGIYRLGDLLAELTGKLRLIVKEVHLGGAA